MLKAYLSSQPLLFPGFLKKWPSAALVPGVIILRALEGMLVFALAFIPLFLILGLTGLINFSISAYVPAGLLITVIFAVLAGGLCGAISGASWGVGEMFGVFTEGRLPRYARTARHACTVLGFTAATFLYLRATYPLAENILVTTGDVVVKVVVGLALTALPATFFSYGAFTGSMGVRAASAGKSPGVAPSNGIQWRLLGPILTVCASALMLTPLALHNAATKDDLTVYTVAREIPAGMSGDQAIADGYVGTEQWSPTKLGSSAPSVVTNLDEIRGKVARYSLTAESLIIEGSFVRPG